MAELQRASGSPSRVKDQSVTFQQEKIVDVCEEIAELLVVHWREVEFYQDIPLNPDMRYYLNAEEKNACVVLTVRADKRLIGYLVYLLMVNPKYQTQEASDDIHYLLPEYRNSSIGLKLFRFGEAEMRKRGVKVIVARTKSDPKLNHGAIFEYLGYDKQEIVYTKRL